MLFHPNFIQEQNLPNIHFVNITWNSWNYFLLNCVSFHMVIHFRWRLRLGTVVLGIHRQRAVVVSALSALKGHQRNTCAGHYGINTICTLWLVQCLKLNTISCTSRNETWRFQTPSKCQTPNFVRIACSSVWKKMRYFVINKSFFSPVKQK